ncbi:hypothetical protein NCER_102269, partial [Vairimorpha ceranae BRL01]
KDYYTNKDNYTNINFISNLNYSSDESLLTIKERFLQYSQEQYKNTQYKDLYKNTFFLNKPIDQYSKVKQDCDVSGNLNYTDKIPCIPIDPLFSEDEKLEDCKNKK